MVNSDFADVTLPVVGTNPWNHPSGMYSDGIGHFTDDEPAPIRGYDYGDITIDRKDWLPFVGAVFGLDAHEKLLKEAYADFNKYLQTQKKKTHNYCFLPEISVLMEEGKSKFTTSYLSIVYD